MTSRPNRDATPRLAAEPRRVAERAENAWGMAIARAFEVLCCFTPQAPVLGNSDIVRATGLPKATVSRLTHVLTELGYVHRVVPSGKYRLAWGVVSLGYPMLTSMPLRQVARPAMHELAMQSRVNVNMGTLHQLSVVFVESVRCDETSVNRPDIGARRPLMHSAMGRALLFSLGKEQRMAMLNRVALAHPKDYQAFAPKFEQAMRDIVAQGFCTSDGEYRPGYVALAVPMRLGRHDEPIAFNCAAPSHVVSRQRLQCEIGPRMTCMVRRIEQEFEAALASTPRSNAG